MELLQLKYFLAAAKYEHITHAASALHIAQPALTQSIKRLESELGMPLFEREGRSVHLNPSGKLLQTRLTPIMNELDAIPQLLTDDLVSRGKVIHLNVQAASTIVTEQIIRFKEQYPDVDFQLAQHLIKSEADVSVTTSTQVLQPMPGETVFPEKVFLAVPASSPYAGRNSIRLKEVADEGFICLSPSWTLRTICDQFCMRAGFMPHIAFESDNPDAVRNLIGANLGIGFWPAYSWGSTELPGVALISIEEPDCRRSITVHMRSNIRPGSPAELFCGMLTEKLNELSRG